MTDDPDRVDLVVGALKYAGWKSIRITQSMESLSGSFALGVSDRWGGVDSEDEFWPLSEGDACRVLIGGEPVIDGYIDKRRLSATKDSRTLSYQGRDRAGDLIDCSAIVDLGTVSKSKWSFYDVDVLELATKIAEPHGISVSVQPGLAPVLTRDKKVVVHPGDSCFEVIARAAAAIGLLVISDGSGGIVLTRASTERAAPLIEGSNILAAEVDYDASDRFYRYLLSTQVPGTDDASGEATRIQAEAIDEGVTRRNRVLLIKPDKGYSTADSRRRADWEARIRAARAEKVMITVAGWRQPGGKLWAINRRSYVRAPRLVGVDGDLQISQVDFAIDSEGGRITQLGLVRPDAFTPEPAATVRASGGAWKELANGGL